MILLFWTGADNTHWLWQEENRNQPLQAIHFPLKQKRLSAATSENMFNAPLLLTLSFLHCSQRLRLYLNLHFYFRDTFMSTDTFSSTMLLLASWSIVQKVTISAALLSWLISFMRCLDFSSFCLLKLTGWTSKMVSFILNSSSEWEGSWVSSDENVNL